MRGAAWWTLAVALPVWLCLFLYALGVVTAHAWIPSATYAAGGSDFLLLDGGSSGSLRMDQLATTSSVGATDAFMNCQACGSGTQPKQSTLTQIATAVTGIITSTQNAFSAGQQIVPSALTNGSNIAVNLALSHVFTIQLSASGQQVQCPTGITSGDFIPATFLIQQPNAGGAYDLSWDTCYYFTGGAPTIQSNNGLSAGDHVYDMQTCLVRGGTPVIAFCPTPASALSSSRQFVLRGNHVTSGYLANGLTASVTITNSTAGDLRTVELFGCVSGCVAGSGAAQATSVTDGTNSCSAVTRAFYNGANGLSTDIWICPKIAVASPNTATVKATWPQSMGSPCIMVQEWPPSVVAPDAGLGNTVTGNSAAPSYATNGAITQVGELVLSIVNAQGTVTSTAGTTIDQCGANTLVQYQLPNSLGTITNSDTTNQSGAWSASIGALQHY